MSCMCKFGTQLQCLRSRSPRLLQSFMCEHVCKERSSQQLSCANSAHQSYLFFQLKCTSVQCSMPGQRCLLWWKHTSASLGVLALCS